VPAAAFDLVLLINAAQFIGDLSGVMQGAARALNETGVFVLTVEPHAGQVGFGIHAQSGRFGHSAAYVRQVAGSAGLRVLKESNAALYVDVNAQAFILAKGNG
jgi:predicted TPR repeat methyltransferase